MAEDTCKDSTIEIENGDYDIIRKIEVQNDTEALKSLYKIALSTRDFEITQLVQRNNFLMIFQGVIFAGVMQSSHTKPLVSFMVCLVGFCVSLYQVGMASGAKFWQEYWEEVVKAVENRLLFLLRGEVAQRSYLIALFHGDINTYERIVRSRLSEGRNSFMSLSSWLIMKRFSVSRIPIYVGLTLALVWFILLISMIDVHVEGFSFSLHSL
ncbi:hypothetical protein [Vibrio sp. 2089]|uniref:RipA family octameric membrane protein n=1 Tax=Vibrio sp. 2089 TaxID=3074591 RepID=UPI0029648A54|nr:hypothetical protein [Vibrio sp. 2089]MDW2109850.1 hypothetical protein [Vibrio sp. 2089]